MPITENNFTQEEFDAALTANPALVAAVRGSLATRKFIIHDEAEHASYLKTTVEPKIVSEANKRFHENLEKDVKELFGEEKATADEKSYVYLKRVAGAKMGTLKQMEGELEKLKAGHNPSQADKDRIKQLEDGLKAKETEYKDALSKKDSEINTIKTSGLIEKQLAGLRAKYKDNLPKELVETYENNLINELVKNVRYGEDGKPVIFDGDKPVVGANLLPLSIEEFLVSKLGSIIDTGKKGQGTGTKADENKQEAQKFTALPSDVKTKVQLTAYLLKLGYVDGSAEMDKILAEEGKNLPLR